MRTGSTSTRERIEFLLRKTIENGATPSEEIAAVQLAHMIVRQHGLDMAAFKVALAKIGDPPRYLVTDDGFLMPADVACPAKADEKPIQRSIVYEPPGVDVCVVSPTRRHRMERYMRGTMATGMLYCVHCGVRIEREPNL